MKTTESSVLYPVINRDQLLSRMVESGHWDHSDAVKVIRIAADQGQPICFGGTFYSMRRVGFVCFPANGRRETWRNAPGMAW